MKTLTPCAIKNIAVYLPDKVETNADLAVDFPSWNYHKIEKIVGVKQRHILKDDETALDIAYQACLKLFEEVDKNIIDFVLLCTQSGDYLLPSSACILQNRLQLPRSLGAYDFNMGCTGYIMGLVTAKGLVASGIAKNVLLVNTDAISKRIYKHDRGNRLIFGDGATATLISATEFNAVGEFSLGTDGSGFDNLIILNGGIKKPFEPEALEWTDETNILRHDNFLYMNGPNVFNFTIDIVPSLIADVLEKNNLDLCDVDFFIFHQANQYMLEYLKDLLGIEKEKFYINMLEVGNTSSATIPIALKDAIDKGVIRDGSRVLLAAFGVGYSYGATIVII